MGVNVTLDFGAQKSTSIHHKSNPYGFMELKDFCYKNIYIYNSLAIYT